MMTRTDGKDTYYIYMVQGISQEIDKANLPESAPNPPEVVEQCAGCAAWHEHRAERGGREGKGG